MPAAATLVLATILGTSEALSQEIQLTSDPFDHVNPQWSPNGQWIAYERVENGKSQLFKIASSGGSEVSLLPGEGAFNHFNPRWSPVPDAQGFLWIAYAGDEAGKLRLFVVREDGAVKRQRTEDPVSDRPHRMPRWSPDGTWLVFERGQVLPSEASSIYRAYSSITFGSGVAADVSRDIYPIALHRYDYAPGGFFVLDLMATRPVWSPATSPSNPTFGYIVHERRKDHLTTDRKLKELDFQGSDTGEGPPNTNFPMDLYKLGDTHSPEWKFNGNKIVFASNQFPPGSPCAGGVDYEIAWIKADGTNLTCVTNNPDSVNDDQPAWSFSAICSRIAFRRRTGDGPGEIWVAGETSGSGETLASEGTEDHGNPQWSPVDASRLVYQQLTIGRWQLVTKVVFCPIHP